MASQTDGCYDCKCDSDGENGQCSQLSGGSCKGGKCGGKCEFGKNESCFCVMPSEEVKQCPMSHCMSEIRAKSKCCEEKKCIWKNAQSCMKGDGPAKPQCCLKNKSESSEHVNCPYEKEIEKCIKGGNADVCPYMKSLKEKKYNEECTEQCEKMEKCCVTDKKDECDCEDCKTDDCACKKSCCDMTSEEKTS